MAALSKYARRAGRHRGADAIRIGSCGRRLHDIAVSCNLNPRLVPVASCRLLGRYHRFGLCQFYRSITQGRLLLSLARCSTLTKASRHNDAPARTIQADLRV
jgi:hypothetical protein